MITIITMITIYWLFIVIAFTVSLKTDEMIKEKQLDHASLSLGTVLFCLVLPPVK